VNIEYFPSPTREANSKHEPGGSSLNNNILIHPRNNVCPCSDYENHHDSLYYTKKAIIIYLLLLNYYYYYYYYYIENRVINSINRYYNGRDFDALPGVV
jgi:hypothetical protein